MGRTERDWSWSTSISMELMGSERGSDLVRVRVRMNKGSRGRVGPNPNLMGILALLVLSP